MWGGLERNVGSQSLWFQPQQSPFTTFSNQLPLSLLFSIHLQLCNSLFLLAWTFNNCSLLTLRPALLLELLGNPQLTQKSPERGKRREPLQNILLQRFKLVNKLSSPTAKHWKAVTQCTVAFLLLELFKDRINKHFSGTVWVYSILF